MLAVLLDDVQCFIRVTEELTEVSSFCRDTNRADGSPEWDIHVFAHEFFRGLNDLTVEVLGDLFNISFIQGILNESDEFVTAETTAHVAFTDSCQDEFGETDQDTVAHVVSVDIVDELETVEVDHHEHTGLVLAELGQDLLGSGLVVQTRHRIGRHFFLKTADLDRSSVDRDEQPDDVTREHADDEEEIQLEVNALIHHCFLCDREDFLFLDFTGGFV